MSKHQTFEKDPIPALLGAKLNAEGYDLVDLVAIPTRSDRMIQIRTVEDALNDFDGETISYLVQVKRKPAELAGATDLVATMVRETIDLNDAAAEPSLDIGVRAVRPPAPPAAARNASVPRAATASAPKVQSAPAPATAARVGTTTAQVITPPEEETMYLANGKVNVPFLMKNAQVLFKSSDYDLARNIYNAVLHSGEEPGPAHLWIARTFEAQGRMDEAERHFGESLAFQPSLDAYQRLAAILIRRKQDQKAAELMERALNLKGLSDRVRFELHKASGNCWLRCERMPEAEKNYRKALEIQPASDVILANLGALCLQMGRIDESAQRFQGALATNARNDKALAGLGSCAIAKGDKRAAHDYFARALEIELNNPNAIFHLVRCAYELKSYATAARVLSEYIQIAPVNTNLLYSLAGLQFHLGRLQEARATVGRVLQLNPQHPGANELNKTIDNYN